MTNTTWLLVVEVAAIEEAAFLAFGAGPVTAASSL